MSFERSYCTESHEKIKQILIFGDKSLLLTCWVTYIMFSDWKVKLLLPATFHQFQSTSNSCSSTI